jgi:hypothetical protein
MHTVVSWDIGIKNLAYCIIIFTDNSFNIIKWDIINLSDDRMKCEHILKGGSGTCEKIAKHIFCIKETGDEKKYYCKTHIKKADYKLIIPLDDIKCDKCKQYAVKVVDGTDIGWCEKHCAVESGKYKRRCIRKIDQSCTKQSKGKLAESMYAKLDEIPQMMQVNEVLLENQPVLKNPTMKSIGDLLFGYFIIRGVCDNKGLFDVANVRHISASGKLKVNKNNSDTQLKKGKNDKDVYNITKDLGIKYTTALINEEDLKHLNTYKKKDDLCDAFLQAIRVHYGDTLPAEMVMKLKQATDEELAKPVKPVKKAGKSKKNTDNINTESIKPVKKAGKSKKNTDNINTDVESVKPVKKAGKSKKNTDNINTDTELSKPDKPVKKAAKSKKNVDNINTDTELSKPVKKVAKSKKNTDVESVKPVKKAAKSKKNVDNTYTYTELSVK